MKKILFIFSFLALSVFLAGCNIRQDYDIVTTLYPHYDFARAIAGDKLTVGLIIPPGVEAHGFEPTSGNIITINNAKLFVYTSNVMEPWAADAVVAANDVNVLNMEQHVDPDAEPHSHEHHTSFTGFSGKAIRLLEDDDHHHHDGEDPHYWVDLVIAMQMIDVLLEHIIELDPANAEYYTERAEAYHHELEELHEEIDAFLHSIPLESREIYHAGHVNMAFFAARYHLTVHALTEEYAPDGNPTSTQIASMIDEIKEKNAKYLFFEELTTPRVATTIQTELARESYVITLLLFHGVHNVSASDFKNNVSYLELMEENFNNLKIALDQLVVNPA